jgi:hypothetical protein
MDVVVTIGMSDVAIAGRFGCKEADSTTSLFFSACLKKIALHCCF